MPLTLALVHHPVVNKRGETVVSSITNFDIHDIARSCRTYGLDRYFLVTPTEPQQWLARRIVRHWLEGWGAEYNSNRGEALQLIEVLATLDDVRRRCIELWGRPPRFAGTSARAQGGVLALEELRAMLKQPEEVTCLVFGTGWGLHPDLLRGLDFLLEPILGAGDYNHLSVRAAVAIYLDRLRGHVSKTP